jgi:hypothetical protein
MTIGLKVIDRKRAIMVYMRVKRQHQRRTLLYDPHPCMAPAMDPALMTFGMLEPTLQIQIVFREIGRLTTHKQPRLKTAHHLGKLLVHGVSA